MNSTLTRQYPYPDNAGSLPPSTLSPAPVAPKLAIPAGFEFVDGVLKPIVVKPAPFMTFHEETASEYHARMEPLRLAEEQAVLAKKKVAAPAVGYITEEDKKDPVLAAKAAAAKADELAKLTKANADLESKQRAAAAQKILDQEKAAKK